MLPTINLQLTELTQFDTGSSGFTPDAPAEPTALFADLLALGTGDQPAGGETLPLAGNVLPLSAEELAADGELFGETELLAATDPEAGLANIPETPETVLAGRSEVADPAVVEVSLELQAVPDIELAPVTPAEELPILREISLSVQNPAGKDSQPTPPGPVEPAAADARDLRALPAALSAAAARDAAPQVGADPALRQAVATAARREAGITEPNLPRVEVAERPEAALSRQAEAVAARAGELRGPVPSELAPQLTPTATTEIPRVAIEAGAQAGQGNAQHTIGIADIHGGEMTAGPRVAAEPASPRITQAVTQIIELPVQQPDWDRAISERVVMMANNKLQQAEIRLTPAELGPLRVQVSVDDGAANVSFQAQHAMTREAIEQALPRLRELFAENGLTLGQTNVGNEGATGREESRADTADVMAGEAADVLTEELDAPVLRSRVESGLIDTFV